MQVLFAGTRRSAFHFAVSRSSSGQVEYDVYEPGAQFPATSCDVEPQCVTSGLPLSASGTFTVRINPDGFANGVVTLTRLHG